MQHGVWMWLAWTGMAWAQDPVAPPDEPDVVAPAPAPAPTPPEAPASAPAPATVPAPCDPNSTWPARTVHAGVLPDGGVCIQGARIEGSLSGRARSIAEAHSGHDWILQVDPGASPRHTAWVVRMLSEGGISELELRTVAVAEPPALAAPVAGGTADMASSTASAFRPIGDLRVGLGIDRLDAIGADDGVSAGVAYGAPKLVLGVAADMGIASAMLSVRAASRTTVTEVGFATVGGDSGVLSLPAPTDGWGIRPNDAWVEVRPFRDAEVAVRTGVQQTVFGTRDRFEDPVHGLHIVALNEVSTAQRAGLVTDRSMGMSLRSTLARDRVEVDLLASNGPGHMAAEDNAGKDLSGRVRVAAAESLEVAFSGLYGSRGATDKGQIVAWSAVVGLEGDQFRVSAEGFGGSVDADISTEEATPFIGTEGVLMGWVGAGGTVERFVVATRLGYFDPQSGTIDGDANMLLDASLRADWATEAQGLVYTGLGYSVGVPMDITADVTHGATLQAGWTF